MRRSHYAFALLLMLACAAAASAQFSYPTDTRPVRGFMPTADQVMSPLDSVDPVSGKLHVELPLGSLPRGRAGFGFDVDLIYDSNLYDIQPEYAPVEMYPERYIQRIIPSETGGWNYNFKNIVVDLEEEEQECDQVLGFKKWRVRVGLPDGSMHIMHIDNTTEGQATYSGNGFYEIMPDGYKQRCIGSRPQFVTGTRTYYSADSSFLKLEFNAQTTPSWDKLTWRLYFPDGRRIVRNGTDSPSEPYGSVYLYDANNNRIRMINVCPNPECTQPYTSILDDADREVRVTYKVIQTATKQRDLVTAPSPVPNENAVWAVDWEWMYLGGENRKYQWTFDPPELPSYQLAPFQASMWVVKYIHLPIAVALPGIDDVPVDWKSYAFTYSDVSDDGYGQMDSMRTPGKALYTYKHVLENYSTENPGLYASTENLVHDNTIESRKITHDTVTDVHWTYTFTSDSSTFKNELGTSGNLWQVVHTFFAKNNPNDWRSGLITKIEEPHGAVQKREWKQNKVYNLRNASAYKTPNNPFIERETVTVGNSTGYPSKTAVTDFAYDKNGNVFATTSYDWVAFSSSGVENPGTELIRRLSVMDYWVVVPSATVTPVEDHPSAYWQPHNPAFWSTNSARRLDASRRRTTSPDGNAIQAITEWEFAGTAGGNPYTNGNVTAEKHWDSVKAATPPMSLSDGNAQVLTRTYDQYGNVTEVGGDQIRTHLIYDATLTLPAGVVLTDVEEGYDTPAERTFEYTWTPNGTAVVQKKDVDNNLVTTFAYDIVSRQLTAEQAGLRRTETIYSDQFQHVTTRGDLFALGDAKLQTRTHYDQLGRPKLVETSDGPPLGSQDDIKVTTTYTETEVGPRIVTSTPYRNTTDLTLEWTCTQKDRLGRVIDVAIFKEQAPSDCAAASLRTGRTSTFYNAENTQVAQEAHPSNTSNVYRRDALGRLLEVIEDSASGGFNYSTTYTYDALDNLTAVSQGVQTRSFNYSSLGRLQSTKQPELSTFTCGTQTNVSVCYTYYDTGDLATRTDARNIVTTLTYDGLRRVETKTYTDATPDVTYTYHLTGTGSSPNIGQLKSVKTQAGSTVIAETQYTAYDALGRVTRSTHAIDGLGPAASFTYDWFRNDALKLVQYPSARVVNYEVDDAGRTKKVASGTTTYADMTATGITHPYAPDGRLAKMKLGNGLFDMRDYKTPGDATLYRLATTANGNDRLELSYSFHATKNNGNLQNHTITNGGTTTWTQTFGYDALNRLTTANETNGFSRTNCYDRYGNRWVCQSSGLSSPVDVHEPLANVFNDNTNKMTNGPTYDPAGNQTLYTPFTLGYDAENRTTTITDATLGTMTLIYDGEGRRVKKSWAPGGGTPTTTYYVYNALGELALEYSTEPGTGIGTLYPFEDLLGSVRGVTDSTNALVECYDYLPFGRFLGRADNARPTCHPNLSAPTFSTRLPQKFTGQERDTELPSPLDYFGARYYSGAQGRFLSPDAPFVDQSPEDPQSWNMYAYVRNNPLNQIDRTGRSCVELEGGIFGDDGDGKGCDKAGVKASTAEDRERGGVDIIPMEVDVVDEPDSLLAFLLAPSVPRYVENDVPLSDDARKTLAAVYVQTTQRLSCLGVPTGLSGVGYGLFRAGQPVPGTKPFISPGSSIGTSPISEALRGITGKTPFGVSIPTPVGGPGTGTPFRISASNKVGAILGRYAPFLGIAGMGVASVLAVQCVSQ